MGVHYEILSRSMRSLRTTIVPRFVSLLQSSGLPFAGCPEVLAKSVIESALVALIAGKAGGMSATSIRSAIKEASPNGTPDAGDLLVVLVQCPEVAVMGGRGVSLHPAFARKLANGARAFAEKTQRQVDWLWFDEDYPVAMRRQVMALRMYVEAAESLAARASYHARCNGLSDTPRPPPRLSPQGLCLKQRPRLIRPKQISVTEALGVNLTLVPVD